MICDTCRVWIVKSWDQWSIRQDNLFQAQRHAEAETERLGFKVLAPTVYPCPSCGGIEWATATPPLDAPLSSPPSPPSPLLRFIVGALVAVTIGFAIAMTAVSIAVGGERIQCASNPRMPIREHWSWRSGIDGRPQRCWFRGYMRPISELTWGLEQEVPSSSAQPPAASTEEDKPASFKDRWR